MNSTVKSYPHDVTPAHPHCKDTVASWRHDNPTGHKCDLVKTGLLSRSSVNRYWDSCGEGKTPLSAAERVILWRAENPSGSKSDCIRETGLSRRSVFLRWNEKPGPKEQKNEKGEVVDEIKISVDQNGQQFFDF